MSSELLQNLNGILFIICLSTYELIYIFSESLGVFCFSTLFESDHFKDKTLCQWHWRVTAQYSEDDANMWKNSSFCLSGKKKTNKTNNKTETWKFI